MEKTAGPASKQHPADNPATSSDLEDCVPRKETENGCRPEIVSNRSPTWKKTVASGMLPLCCLQGLSGICRTESLLVHEVFGCPLGAFFLFIIKGLGTNKSGPACFKVLCNSLAGRILPVGLLHRRTGRVCGFSCYTS